MRKLSDEIKMDVGLVPQALNNTNATGAYHAMSMYGKALVILTVGAMAATKTSIIEFLQATDAAGTGAKGIPTTVGQEAIATITANIKVTKATVTCATVLAAEAVTINGLVFTAAAAADLPNRVFAVGADDTACAASLVLAINHAIAGVPGVTATSALGVVTLVSTEPGETTITIADAAATITPATIQAKAFVEVDASQMDLANGFTHLAAKVTTTANTVVSVEFIRSICRFTPVQAVGASKVV